jgi:parvulin-like peptidyl-prolyl isomerase
MKPSSLLAASLLALSAFAADVTLVEQIVAKVNGEIITRTELARERDRMRQGLEQEVRQRRMQPSEAKQILSDREKDILRDKIDQMLLQQRAKDMNVNVDAEVTKYLGQIQAEQKIADPEKFQQWIRDNSGQSFEDFKNEIRNQYMGQRIVGQEVSSKVSVSREEIVEYYEKNKASFVREDKIILREILVANEGKGAPAAEKKAKDVAARAKKGERFAELARDNSDAPTAKQGGDIGAFKKGELRKDLEDLVWNQPKGYTTEPIKLDAGWLILRVEEHFKQGQATLEEVENEIRDKLFMPRFTPKVREYLTELRMNSFLEIREGFIDSGAAPGKDTKWTDPALLKPETVTKEEVASQTRRKRLLWLVPIPGTSEPVKGKSSSN